MDDARLDLFHPRDSAVVVSIRGALGAPACDAFERSIDDLIQARHQLVILDVADLTYLGSRALGDMIRLRNAQRELGGKVRLAAPRPEIARLFELARLDEAFPTFRSVQDALSYAGPNL